MGGALENAIYLYWRGIENAIFCMGVSKMPFLYGGLEDANFCIRGWWFSKMHFFVRRVSKMPLCVWGAPPDSSDKFGATPLARVTNFRAPPQKVKN